MVAYRLEAKVIGRSSGRSATGAAAYRAAERIPDDRTGLIRDYTRKTGVLHKEIMTPGNPEHQPGWPQNRAKLWNAIEAVEKRKDAQLCREILVNLPHELTRDQQIELVREFVRAEFVRLGMVADIAIHAPHRKGDDRNTHAHVMLTMREITADGKFGPKVRDWNSPELLERWREQWAHHQNRALEKAGRSERVDHRSLQAQGIDREPEPKQGPVATQMEREGRPSKAGDDRRAVKARNAARDRFNQHAKIIDLHIARIERDEREAGPSQPPALPLAVIMRQQGLFDIRANTSRAHLQTARHAAEGEQGRSQTEQRRELEQRQQGFYGPRLDALHREAAAIKARQQQVGGLRGLAYRITGRAARDKVQAEQVQAGIADIGQRKIEQREALNARQREATAKLAGRYARHDRQLEQRIVEARARRENEGWIPPEARREATTGQEIERTGGIHREAENSPVEGLSSGTGETTPQEPEATTAQPEAAQQQDSEPAPADAGGEGQEWTEAERNARIEAERERQAQLDRERGSNDNDGTGREME